MQTYSHFILTGALNGRFGPQLQSKATKLPPLHTGILLLGSVLPDLPLITISLATIGYDWVTGATGNASVTRRLFRVWFFEDPWVIAAQNLFHSPLLIAIFMLLGFWFWQRGHSWGSKFFWLSAAAMLHTLVDIPLHANDGPLLLFPLNWTWRYHSPISYWDRNYYGREWSVFEHLLDAALLLYIFVRYWPALQAWRWQRKKY